MTLAPAPGDTRKITFVHKQGRNLWKMCGKYYIPDSKAIYISLPDCKITYTRCIIIISLSSEVAQESCSNEVIIYNNEVIDAYVS